jgi:carbon starvation protein CstA
VRYHITIGDIEHQVQAILERNERVEADKAWETSITRRTIIAGITYLTACLLLLHIHVEQFYWVALVPTGGYILSTLSLPWAKEWWLRYRNARR